MNSESEILQRRHYNEIALDYERHYGDYFNQRYRDVFVRTPMFAGLDFKHQMILEAMCGGGTNTNFLLTRHARVIGLDISDQMIASFKANWPQAEAVCASMAQIPLADSSVDGVLVMGGLHHLPPQLSVALSEIHRVLKPGGWFCFFEPHAASWFDRFRRLWYRYDSRMFAANEQAIDVAQLKAEFADKFVFDFEKYGGNLAYLFIMNSLVLRLPLWLKVIYFWPLMSWEKLISPCLGKGLGLFVIGRWRKK